MDRQGSGDLRRNKWARDAASVLLGGTVGGGLPRNGGAGSESDSSDDDSPARAGRSAGGSGLQNGDVVAFAHNGLPYVVDRVALSGGAEGADVLAFVASGLEAGVSIADSRTHLMVTRQGRWLGFRSNAAGGKMLQARKRGANKLCFYNQNFGTFEQWETNDMPTDESWTTALVQLRNRRLPGFVLSVEVLRVPDSMRATRTDCSTSTVDGDSLACDDHDDRGSLAGTVPESEAASGRNGVCGDTASMSGHLPTLSAVDVSMSSPTADHSYTVSVSEHGNAFRSMSGVLIREWSSFVLKEVNARKAVEKQLGELEEELRSLRLQVHADINVVRDAWDSEMRGCIAEASQIFAQAQEARRAAHRRVIGYMRSRCAGRAFGNWREDLSRARREKRLLGRAARRITNLQLLSLLNRWREATVGERRRRIVLRRAIHTFSMRHARSAFIAWSEFTSYERLVRVVQAASLSKLLRLWQRRETSKAWIQWKAWLAAERKERAIFVRTLYQTQARAFSSWRGLTVQQQEARRRFGRIAGKIMKSQLASAFAGWHSRKCDHQRHRNLLARVLARFRQQVQARAFGAWSEFTMERLATRRRLTWVAGKLLKAKLANAFVRWADGVQLQRENFTAVVKMMRRTNQRMAASAFVAWNKIAKQRRLVTVVVRRALHASAGRLVRGVFTAWASLSETRKGQMALVRRTLARLMARRVALAFATWVEATEEMRQQRSVARRVAVFWMRRSLVKAFQRWAEMCAEVRVLRHKAASVVRRALHAAAVRTFNTWYESVVEAQETRAKLMYVVRRLTQLQVSAAFNRWVQYVDDLARQRFLVGKTMARIVGLKMGAAFLTWRDNCAAARRAALTTEESMEIRHRRMLADVWDAWVALHLRLRRQRRILASAAAKWSGAAKVGCFYAWHGWWAENKRIRHKVAARMSHVVEYGALCAWVQVTTNARRDRLLVQHAVARLRAHGLTSALNGWRAWALECRHQRDRLMRVAGRMRHSTTAKAFAAWERKATDELHLRVRLERFLRRWAMQSLSRAFQSWVAAMEHVMEVERRAGAYCAAHRLAHLELLLAFEAFRRVATEARAASRLAGLMLLSGVHRFSERAFLRWAALARRELASRRLLSRALVHARHDIAADAFATWVARTADAKASSRREARAVIWYWRHYMLNNVALWRENAVALRRARVLVSRFVGKSAARREHMVFTRWAATSARRAAVLRAAETWSATLPRRMLMRAWERMVIVARDGRARRETARALGSLIQRHEKLSTLQRAFESLSRAVGVASARRRTGARLTAKLDRQWKAAALGRWVAYVDGVHAQRERIKRCISSKRVTAQWFMGWYWDAFADEIRDALGLISNNCDDVMGELYESRRAGTGDASVFRQWQLLGQGLEAMSLHQPAPAQFSARSSPAIGATAPGGAGTFEEGVSLGSFLGSPTSERWTGTMRKLSTALAGSGDGGSAP